MRCGYGHAMALEDAREFCGRKRGEQLFLDQRNIKSCVLVLFGALISDMTCGIVYIESESFCASKALQGMHINAIEMIQ